MDRYEQILKEYWGHDSFRGIQRDIIDSVAAGRDTLGLMPTGGGKSITFQVPALAMEGVCLVVTPLIALMHDQVLHLRQRGIRAEAISSEMTRADIGRVLDNCIFGGVKLLYLSPERLATELFQAKVRRMRVCLIAVDEAHCISQWGYDFRPAYLRIAELRGLVPEAPVLALTATATPQVADDIQEQLAFRQKNVLRMSFRRDNLAYVVRRTGDKEEELLHILACVPGSAIVYTRSRDKARETAAMLATQGISAAYFHAGIAPIRKSVRQQEWQQGKTRVIVCTNAFGMGIDKPDVRLVAHIDPPNSIEEYFQEAGRAGRDGGRAYAVLLLGKSDTQTLKRRVEDSFPPEAYIRKVYDDVACFLQVGAGSGAGHAFLFDIDKFCRTFRHFPTRADAALHVLQQAGYLHYDVEPSRCSRLAFTAPRSALNRIDDFTPHEEAVLTSVLRRHAGIFVDYVNISEERIMDDTGLTRDAVYHALVSFDRRDLASYIPARTTPLLSYTRDRLPGSRLSLPAAAYEERKLAFRMRTEALAAYATNNHVCRSRQLLAYFGEETKDNCGMCDVCVAH